MPRDNALARAVFLCRLGEIRDRSFEQQGYRASGLTLVTAAIALWNTVYIERAVQASARNGEVLDPKLLKYLSPLGWEHINLAGDYQWAAQETHSGAIQATSNPEPILNVLYCPFSDVTPFTAIHSDLCRSSRQLGRCTSDELDPSIEFRDGFFSTPQQTVKLSVASGEMTFCCGGIQEGCRAFAPPGDVVLA